MKVFLEYLVLYALLLAGPKATGSALRDQSHILKSAKLEIENLLYDAIFNSSALASLQHGDHGTSNISVDSRTQECLDIYTWRNFELLHVSGMKMRRCMRVSEMDLEKYFNIHRNEVVDLKRGVIDKVAHCTRNRSAFRMLDCYVDVIMTALNLVKSSDDFWRQKSCLRTELYGLIQKLDDESDRMMNCFQNLESNQSNSSGNGQLVFKQPDSSTVQADSVNNSSLTTSLDSSIPSSAFNSSHLSPNKTNVLETQKPLNDSINQNATYSLRPTQPLQNTTNNSRSLTRLNFTLHNINDTNLGMRNLQLNNSINLNLTNSNEHSYSYFNSTSVLAAPWNLYNNSTNTSTSPWITQLAPWNNSNGINVTTPSSLNSTHTNITLHKQWITTLAPRNSSIHYNATKSSFLSTNQTNITKLIPLNTTLAPWNNGTKANNIIPLWSTGSNFNNTNTTESSLNNFPTNESFRNQSDFGNSGIKAHNSTIASTNVTASSNSSNNKGSSGVQSPVVQTTEKPVNNKKKPSWWASMWKKVTKHVSKST